MVRQYHHHERSRMISPNLQNPQIQNVLKFLYTNQMLSPELSDFSLASNELYTLYKKKISSGVKVIDLISGNPTQRGINFPPELLGSAVNNYLDGFQSYQPDPKGLAAARHAVSSYYERDHLSVSEENIILTPGTSESYFYLLKLLARPFQEILCPRPSYPLFDYIAKLSDVSLSYYDLTESSRWSIDFESLTGKITKNTAAIVVVSPHNPTGHVCPPSEVKKLQSISEKYRLPLIVDEVFREFTFSNSTPSRFIGGPSPLVFTLNGVSKMFALPQQKIGWIAVSGKDQEAVAESVARLETIADTFLSTGDLSQSILPSLFSGGQAFLSDYRRIVSQRLDKALSRLNKMGLDFFPPDGGFYLLAKPRGRTNFSSDRFVIDLLSQQNVLLHSGSFYDLTTDNYLIISFLPEEEILEEGLARVAEQLG